MRLVAAVGPRRKRTRGTTLPPHQAQAGRARARSRPSERNPNASPKAHGDKDLDSVGNHEAPPITRTTAASSAGPMPCVRRTCARNFDDELPSGHCVLADAGDERRGARAGCRAMAQLRRPARERSGGKAVLRSKLSGGHAAVARGVDALTPARFEIGIGGSHARDRAPSARSEERRRLTQRLRWGIRARA